uniref:Anti-silencing function 1B histone chaperone n=1 Tax=Poecilia reticulata TaxID=8081 RepID=A0A3P9MSX0_POERE
MAKVQVLNVAVLDNPSPFGNPFQFEITFECMEDLPEDLEWKIIYVGSAESEEYDQVLDSVLVGPVPAGRHMFVFQLQRNILASNPRVTRFHINWEGSADKMEDSENVDPSPNVGGMLPPSCVPGKMPALGQMPDNSMDCM